MELEPLNGWANVAFSADWHLGSLFTDYDRWIKHIEYVKNTKGLYIGAVGDLIDNFLRFRNLNPIFKQVLSPKNQTVFLQETLEYIKDKLLFAFWGNHDVEWQEKNASFSEIAEILGQDFVYFNAVGRINLKVGDQIYRLIGSHNFPGHSHWNPTHPLLRAAKKYPGYGVYFQGDKHNSSYLYCSPTDDIDSEHAHMLQVGTFKTLGDTYSNRYFGNGEEGVHTISFCAERKEAVWFPNPEMATRFINNE